MRIGKSDGTKLKAQSNGPYSGRFAHTARANVAQGTVKPSNAGSMPLMSGLAILGRIVPVSRQGRGEWVGGDSHC